MLIKNGRIFLQDRVIENGYLVLEGETIKSFGCMDNLPAYDGDIIDAKGNNVLPGFIDQHIHGANGADHMDATQEALETIATFLPKEGTTSYLATTMTQSVEAVDKALVEIKKYAETSNGPGQAEIMGVHLEGPFISEKHIGAQNPKYVLKPTVKDFDHFYEVSGKMVRLITYAPEEAEKGFTDHLRSLNVVPSAGHTDATYDQIVSEIGQGLSNLTHFHNAMTPHHHRQPGVVTAGFINETLKAEMIVDGIHVNPAVVKATYEIKGADNFIAITDSMRAKGLPDGKYDLGGQEVTKEGKYCRIESGALAGSVAEMDFVVRNIKNFTDCSMRDVVKMSSENSALHLGIFGRKGSIEIGKDADIVIVDNDINVQTTICRGIVAYTK
ncbi:MAG: N-acetylglucosamine-6-phosphate deacetylase [Erysipelothrix sp.]